MRVMDLDEREGVKRDHMIRIRWYETSQFL